jgi:hypothetical protein
MNGPGAYDSPAVQAAIHEEIGRQRHAEHHAVIRAVETLRSWDLDIDSYQAERLLSMWSGRGDLTDDQVRQAVALYLDGRQPTDVLEVALRVATDAYRAATDDDERAEVLQRLVEIWYVSWPSTAVTSPHGPLAAAIVRMVGTARPEYAPVVTLDGQLWRCSGCGAQEATATGESPDCCDHCRYPAYPDIVWRRVFVEVTR